MDETSIPEEYSFSTPKGFGPIVTPPITPSTISSATSFQYPEGFWPDSDPNLSRSSGTRMGVRFQYPEGFWPDSDDAKKRLWKLAAEQDTSFSTPKGFGPIVTHMAVRMKR